MNTPSNKNQSPQNKVVNDIENRNSQKPADTSDNLRKEIEYKTFFWDTERDEELGKELEDLSWKQAKSEANEQIELARASGYNEGCYVQNKETLKEVLKDEVMEIANWVLNNVPVDANGFIIYSRTQMGDMFRERIKQKLKELETKE